MAVKERKKAKEAREVVRFFVVATNGHGKVQDYLCVASGDFKTREELYKAVFDARNELAKKYPKGKVHIGAADSIASLIASFREIR